MAFREQKASSRVCTDKVQDRAYRAHRQALQSVRPTIDVRAPQSFTHMARNPKKAQLEADRQDRIMRDNKTLYKRMTLIMQKSTLDNHLTTPAPGGGQTRSLNRDLRRQQDIQITRENQALLRRIRQRQPVYSHLAWEQERDAHERHVARLSRFQTRQRPSPDEYVSADGEDHRDDPSAPPAAPPASEPAD